MYVQIRVEERALILSVMANMMSLLFIVAAAERVSCCVGYGRLNQEVVQQLFLPCKKIKISTYLKLTTLTTFI